MYWELWDTEVGALVETFLSADEGLQAVREILAVNRPDFIDDLALAAMYEEDESREVELPPALRGEELRARLAEHTRSAGRPLTHGAMKVRIDDKEALQALSWESLRAYLARSDDWRYAEDIPGKAAV